MTQRVKFKTLMTRINRRLAKSEERLCKARPNEVWTLGDYYLVNSRCTTILRARVEPVALAIERGILLPGETVEMAPCAAIAPRHAAEPPRVAASRLKSSG